MIYYSSLFKIGSPISNVINNKIVLRKYKKTYASVNQLEIIGVDENSVTNHQETKQIFSFLNCYTRQIEKRPLLVLTKKEKLILSKLKTTGLKIFVLEELSPHLKSKIKYTSNSKKNYVHLSHLSSSIDEYGTLGLVNSFMIQCHKRIINKLKTKSLLDKYFSLLNPCGIQETYCLKEDRPDRKIFVLDVNSMYASVMQEKFTDPSSLKYYELNQQLENSFTIKRGIYHVRISAPRNDWIKRFHQILINCFGFNTRFFFENNATVDCWISSDELQFYQQHFDYIWLIEAILSENEIDHPLSKLCRSLYSSRSHFKLQGNITEASKCKLLLAAAHSCIHRYEPFTTTFANPNCVIKYILNETNLDEQEISPFLFFHKNRKGLIIKKSNHKISLTRNNICSPHNINSLYYEVIAKARIKLLNLIHKMSGFNDLNICYCNIDSIHVSIPSEQVNTFRFYIDHLIGEGLGELKYEAEGTSGFWLEPGRYTIFGQNGSVQKFANIGFNTPITTQSITEKQECTQLINHRNIPINKGLSLSTAIRLRGIPNVRSDNLIFIDRYNIKNIKNEMYQFLINKRSSFNLISHLNIFK